MELAPGYRPAHIAFEMYRGEGTFGHVSIRTAVLALLVVGFAKSAPDISPKNSNTSHDLSFQAGRVTIEGPLSTLTLCDSVEVAVHRYRLTADQLTLHRTRGGVLVQGPGLVAFCPCVASPITVAFTEATVVPPTDLVIKNAVIRAGGVPVFYTPVLWLRSPNRLGLLAPHFGWRATEGIWIGSGLHVPLRSSDQASQWIMDLNAGGYARGGWDLGGQLTTSRSTTQLRWDKFNTSFIEAESHGSIELESKAIDWSADMLRGSRGRVGFVSPEIATRQSDRARTEFIYADGTILTGAGMRLDAWRASAINSMGLIGPQLRLGVGTSLSKFGHVDSTTTIIGWSAAGQSSTLLLVHSGDISAIARPSVIVAKASIHDRFVYSNAETQRLHAGLSGGELRISAPFVRSWDVAALRWSHWIEPFVLSTAAVGLNNIEVALPRTTQIGTMQVGLSNVAGRPNSDTAFQVELRAGLVSTIDNQTAASAIRSRASGKWLGVGSDVVWARSRSWMSTSRLRIGDPRRVDLRFRIEGRTREEWIFARWLTDEGWTPILRSWLARGGWTSIVEAGLAPTEWLAVNGGLGSDLSNKSIMYNFAEIGYRHPCGCLAISATLSERTGRPGWDAWGMVDLMPQ